MRRGYKLLFGSDGGGSAADDPGLLLMRIFAGPFLALACGLGKLPPSERFLSGIVPARDQPR